MVVNYCILAKKLYEALGHVISEVDCNCDCSHERQGILLPYGDHEISVKTDFKPTEVYVSITDEGLPVCSGDLSTSGVSLQVDGFVLYAHIKTNNGIVKWIVR